MNRRDFLKLSAASLGSAVLGGDIIQALASPDLPATLRANATTDQRDSVFHILNRVTFGPRPGQVEAVKKMGVQAYLEQQFNPDSIDDTEVALRFADFISIYLNVNELYAFEPDPADVIRELESMTVIRALYSKRELFEVMVNFWSDHFSIYHFKEECKLFKTVDDRDVIRKYALGKFRDLLTASAQSPAMLIYLDNAKSDKAHPNENYAREIMELHTLTIGNYTESDVKEVARCFTGWTVQGPKDEIPGSFIFKQELHDDGEKTVLGQTIPAGGGMNDAETVLDILASHPATARHICSKLCRRFIADDPPDSIVKAAVKTFMSTDGDIPSVLRVILASDEFLNAPPKFKRPFEYLMSLYRAFGAEVEVFRGLVSKGSNTEDNTAGLMPMTLLEGMGHLPFNHITPDGYTDYAQWWIGNMLNRWNAAILIATNGLPGSKVDLGKILTDQKVRLLPRDIGAYFVKHLLGRDLTPAELDILWGFVTKHGEPDLKTEAGQQHMQNAIALIAASPAFQYR